ncbi:SpvB/TcaC N-terminal domain-containing protein [Marinoscillum sp. MHG1-6]|uniref:SpvB/TcaC N-terminal domain-containing protein n=1 Tax=Marinoscillum sp. MHG1-6 TaxID=2959627 RepID=UPI0021577BDD|nr:SpvB/TcaC N-terminal domain-containing protein [Marinoscillum sp. MHG1-6]
MKSLQPVYLLFVQLLVIFLTVDPACAEGPEGLIGTTEEMPFDNPVDNIFHVRLDEEVCGNEKAYLVYEVNGVTEPGAVTKSVNDQYARGGYAGKVGTGWRKLSERLDLKDLRQGDNVIRFGTVSKSLHYRVRNVSIRLEESDNERELVLVTEYYTDKGLYLSGFVKGQGADETIVRVGSKNIEVIDGYFEYVTSQMEGAQKSVRMEAVFPDGEMFCHELEKDKGGSPDFFETMDKTYRASAKHFEAHESGTFGIIGAQLDLTDQALDKATRLKIAPLRAVDLAPLDPGMINVTGEVSGYRFLPHGTQFLDYVGVEMAYDPVKIPEGYTEKDIRTYYFDENTHHWVALPVDSVLTESAVLRSLTTHFTDMINGIIKVPESPEVAAYNSTSMKGIKAANPTAGINLMQPPSANNMGNANMSYPLNIPAGRAGMQPQLALSYSNGGGSGWLGLGWSLSVPSINIDTRWGVPRYDPDLETETYLLNGGQLTPVAHRGELRPRDNSDKQFHPRVEGGFQKIIRHADGGDMKKYWWEVVDKSGTRYFYGGNSNGVFDESSVLRTDEANGGGDIAQWCLREVRDLNDNYIRYHYAKVQDCGLADCTKGVPGYEIYCERITYTGHGTTEGSYEVRLNRQTDRRTDISIDGRLGFKRVNAGLLENIEVVLIQNGSEKAIRSYGLEYTEGAFFKTLLSHINEYDAAGELFTTHEMEYYDDVDAFGDYKPFDQEFTDWMIDADDLKGVFDARKEDFKGKATVLSGTRSTNYGLGTAVGVGFNLKLWDKSKSVVANLGYGGSKSYGIISMMDVNGDGLPDKIFLDEDNKFYYRPNLCKENGDPKFGTVPLPIEFNKKSFFLEESSTINGGIEALFGAFVSAGYSRTKSKTTTYMSEVNGDGLPDIVHNGQVWFNHLDTETGKITYSKSSDGTPNLINEGEFVADGLVETDPQERIDLIKQNPLHDVVRMWIAPYAGYIHIDAPVQLIEPTEPDGENLDGVNVKVQVGDEEKWSQRILAGDYTQKPFETRVSVEKGTKIFFRVQSVENGFNDQVLWAPTIQYLNNEPDVLNIYGKPRGRFNSDEDFVLAAQQEIGMPYNGEVVFESSFIKPKTADHIKALITLNSESGSIEEIWRGEFSPDSTVNMLINKNILVDSSDVLKIQFFTDSNIDWSEIGFDPFIYYSNVEDENIQVYEDPEADTLVPLITFIPVPDFYMYSGVQLPAHPLIGKMDSATISVSPYLSLVQFPLKDVTDQLTFTIKTADSLIFKDTLNITAGDTLIEVRSFSGKIRKGEAFYFEFSAKDSLMYGLLNQLKVDVIVDDTLVDTDFGYYYNKGNKTFGHLFRGWGQFSYNGNGENGNLPIDQNKLKISNELKGLAEDDFKDKDAEQLGNTGFSFSNEVFIVMIPHGAGKGWQGYDNFTRLDGRIIQSSRYGVDDIPPLESVGGGSRAINKISITNNFSFSAGISGQLESGFGGGVSGSASFGPSKVVLDFRDMNGDRYPDVVSPNKIQYTNALGGLTSEVRDHGFNDFTHENFANTVGASLSGSSPETKTKSSMTNKSNTNAETGSASVSMGISGNYGFGTSKTRHTFLDINGDGLPDRLKRAEQGDKVSVALNLGYGFGPFEEWDIYKIQSGSSRSYGGGLGVTKRKNSISAGLSLSRSENHSDFSLQDVNGDGLADALYEIRTDSKNEVFVRINQGGSFSDPIEWTELSDVGESRSAGFSANGAFTVGFPLNFAPPMKLVVNPSFYGGSSVSREQNGLRDINGDGYPDFVESINDGQLKVKHSTIARTNMLKKVNRPLGASFTVDYKAVGNTYDHPGTVWTLSEVKVFDGFAGDGVDTLRTAYAYEKGFHDRRERDFYGFEKVISKTLDDEGSVYTRVEQTFANRNYYAKGLLLSEVMTDGGGKKYVEKENHYQFKDINTGQEILEKDLDTDDGNVFPALKEAEQRFYEGETSAGKSTRTSYEYDALGNVIKFRDFGDNGNTDDLVATIDYHKVEANYIMASPKSIEVRGASGTLYRKREASINETNGNVTQIRQFLNEETEAFYDLEYDEYGNLTKITRPENSEGQRMSVEYAYDEVLHTYTTEVSNSYGYHSTASYDFRFGQVLKTVDLNGQEITYELDDKGRVNKITGPYERANGSGYTLKFDYHPEDEVPWALTQHYDPSNPQNEMETATFVDGLGRVLQTKKDGAIYKGDGQPDEEMMIVSGRVLFDAFGRSIKAYYPVSEPTGTQGTFNSTTDGVAPTTTAYDVLNRAIAVVLPDGAETTTEYGFDSDRDGNKQFLTRTTDANGIVTEQFTDVRGRVTAVKNVTTDGPVWTSFAYNAINEQVAATDDQGHSTLSTYDLFGRRVRSDHPDAGMTTYSYDLAGNLTALMTANLAEKGGPIKYKYDFERLTDILYPDNAENDVHYTYGETGAEFNRAGRIVLQEDATGAQEFFYGPLGEVVKNIRTVVIPKFDEQTFTTEWTYDTWNRLTSMAYPDGEVVNYKYNVGGLLKSMAGVKKGRVYNYVKQLGYDKFEQRVFLAYGNGSKMTYSYEADRRRLQKMTASTATSRLFMDNSYTYDKVNNILSLKNNAPVPESSLMGGASEYHYEYDDLYRLTGATGHYTGANEEHRYSLQMAYNTVGGIIHKVQSHDKTGNNSKGDWNSQSKTTYDMTYTYGQEQPHAPTQIGEHSYSYDKNGNQTGWTDNLSGQERRIMWDEENRIRAIYDDGNVNHYIYDASGERVIKAKSIGQAVFINGQKESASGSVGNYTVYVNPYMVLQSGGYTKHYYIEGQRIVSKLGGGQDKVSQGKAGVDAIDYYTKRKEVEQAIVKNLKWVGDDGVVFTAGKSGKVPPGQVKDSGNEAENLQYYYHPDHLGSTSYITDITGEVYQHLEYFAFGETFVEEHSNKNGMPYKFNGKELDEETGLYYYGARYYDPRVGIFYGVDPLTDKYPHLSPYNYASNNPTTNIDLWGLQGLHYMEVLNDGTQRHVIEKNVIVLTQAPKAIPAGASPNKIARINRQNARIAANNVAKVNAVRDELNAYFNGSDGQTTNSAGEAVRFQFNVTGVETNNTDGGTTRQNIILADQNGLISSEQDVAGNNKIVPSAIITTGSPGAYNEGLTTANRTISLKDDAPGGATAHEVGHTLMTRSGKNAEHSSSGLMSTSPSSVTQREVDMIIQDSYER